MTTGTSPRPVRARRPPTLVRLHGGGELIRVGGPVRPACGQQLRHLLGQRVPDGGHLAAPHERTEGRTLRGVVERVQRGPQRGVFGGGGRGE
ncbi:hypothetical protein ACFVYT_22600 [Streptomyces sp. NPDC058290]|uniref:hypothetical protein n=1 Tax=Streptomyces sp. NPDC058290 TaxID=3346426 RepID=UPI0036E5EF90